MITSEQIQELISALETSSYDASINYLPIVYTGQKTLDTLNVVEGSVYYWENNYLVNVDKYHYDDKWYVAVDSADNHAKSFGIIRVDNMPYRTFEYIFNKQSFVMRLDALIYQNLCEPIMIFVNRKFVDWCYIDVVYDGEMTYLLLHGTEYTFYNLKFAELNMVILPYNLDYLGSVESDEYWEFYYEQLCGYLTSSLTLNSSGKLSISVPLIDTVYVTAGGVYGVGAWMYTQYRLYKLGMLSNDRMIKLRKIELTYNEYDDSDNISYTYTTKFNALDIDSFNKETFNSIYHPNTDWYYDNMLFRFTTDGLLDQDDGDLVVTLTARESLYLNYYSTTDKKITYQQADCPNTLTEDNYLVFKDGLFWYDVEITCSPMNTIYIDNPDGAFVEIFTFTAAEALESNTTTLYDAFLDSDYLASLYEYYADPDNTDADYEALLEAASQTLDITFSADLTYEENMANAYQAILAYDVYLFNELYHSNVYSRVLTGAEANAALTVTIDYESRRGLKIPRYKYRSHEVYVMVFVNGELIDTYYKMIAFANFFLIPLETESFADDDVIELLFFKNINNNEISFKMTDNILETCFANVDGQPEILTAEIFKQYIRPKQLKLFSNYPTYIMKYSSLVPEATSSVAFNISFREDDDEDTLYVYKHAIINPPDGTVLEDIANLLGVEPDDGYIPTSSEHEVEAKTEEELDVYNTIIKIGEIIAVDDEDNEIKSTDKRIFTAVSDRKFIYERLYVDKTSYRIEIGARFRFCDNQKQYMLFINGRRVQDEGFLVTIPKFDRPFWGMYLYTARFVNPDDRIELFYVPYEVLDINTEREVATFDTSGYIEIDRGKIDVPLDPNLYTCYINGKKIPSTWLTHIDSWTLRVNQDTLSTFGLMLNKTYMDTIDEVVDYLHGDTYSSYDALIKLIKDNNNLGYDELDRLMGITVQMTEKEDDFTLSTGPIAILNEIIRDFWVTSGYQYNDVVQFVYDYARDEYIEYDENNEFRVLPSMDATQFINIFKNYIHLLYFNYDPDLIQEIGSTIDTVTLTWEYSDPIYGDLVVLTQAINGEDLDVDVRKYSDPTGYSSDVTFELVATTYANTITKSITYHFYNGVYYGTVDEDILQWYMVKPRYLLDDLMAVIPDSDILPSSSIQAVETRTEENLDIDNTIVKNLEYEDESVEEATEQDDEEFIRGEIDDLDQEEKETIDRYQVEDEATADVEQSTYDDGVEEIIEYTDLDKLMKTFTCVLQDTAEIDLTDFIIGSNNYFVYAAPYRLCFKDGEQIIKFILPDVNSDDVKDAGEDDHTIPVYTDGTWTIDTHELVRLDTCEMVYMGTFEYTNNSGYTETYCMWRTNGFFTRLYDDYEFEIHVQDPTVEKERIQTVFTD